MPLTDDAVAILGSLLALVVGIGVMSCGAFFGQSVRGESKPLAQPLSRQRPVANRRAA